MVSTDTLSFSGRGLFYPYWTFFHFALLQHPQQKNKLLVKDKIKGFHEKICSRAVTEGGHRDVLDWRYATG